MHPQEEATRLLADLGEGDRDAADRLLPLIYDELRHLASAHLGRERKDHTLQTTALVHEAYLRLVRHHELGGGDRTRFFALAAAAIRRVLIDHARRRTTVKRQGDRARLELSDEVLVTSGPQVDLLALDEALERLAELDERPSRVVELRFFGGLSIEEVAEVLGVSTRTINEDWKVARAFLGRELSKRDGREV